MGHSLNRTNLTIGNNLIINNSNTQDDYILISGTSGEATWDLKSNYISSNEFNHFVGELYGGGVVTAVWKESGIEKCLIASTQDCRYLDYNAGDGIYFIGDLAPWSNITNIYATASYSSLGASNSVIITSQPGFNPIINPISSIYSGAVQYCLNYINPNLGTGTFSDWYLPSIYELKTLFDNLAIVNKVLYKYSIDSGIEISDFLNEFSGAYTLANIHLVDNKTTTSYSYDYGYWSSTEKSATSSYYMGSNKIGLKISNDSKLNNKRIRPFRIG